MCAKKVYKILKVQNTLLKSVYYITEYTICSLVSHLCTIFIRLFLRTSLPMCMCVLVQVYQLSS